MNYFVDKGSIVRKIWGNGDIVLLIFAGASAEFALNKAVDWLYFTGKLPSDPLARLFSTVNYAREIVFSENDEAIAAINKITAIHNEVEKLRRSKIPDWAYRDVLFMLIDYSIRSFELLERKLSEKEKEEIFTVFNKVGLQMGLIGLPENFTEWMIMRVNHIEKNLALSHFTTDLYKQYRKHLGWFRYKLLLNAQIRLVPKKIVKLLQFKSYLSIAPIIPIYKLCRFLNFGMFIKRLILPSQYLIEIAYLDFDAKSVS